MIVLRSVVCACLLTVQGANVLDARAGALSASLKLLNQWC